MKKLMAIVVSAFSTAVAFTGSANDIDVTADVRAEGLKPDIQLVAGECAGGYGAANLFDGKLDASTVKQGRVLAAAAPVAVTYELPAGYDDVVLTSYALHQLVDYGNYERSPIEWTLSAWSENSQDWVVLDSRTYTSATSPWKNRVAAELSDFKVSYEIAADRLVQARKFKFEMTKNNGSKDSWSIGLGDLDLIGQKGCLRIDMPDQKFDGLKPVVPPAPVVTDLLTGKTLVPDADYTYAFAGDFDRVGTCTCTVTGKGEYAGSTSTVEFKIVLAYGSIYYAKPDGADDAACTMQDPGSINAALALAVAKSGNAVYLADGDYDVSQIATAEEEGYAFNLSNNVTIRGMSDDRTKVRLIGGGDDNKRACFYSSSASTVRNLTVTNFSATVQGCGIFGLYPFFERRISRNP